MADHTMHRGDTKVITCTVVDGAGAAYNLAGTTVWFTVKRAYGDADGSAVLSLSSASGGITIASNVATITIPPAATDGLSVDEVFVYDVQVKAGTSVFTTETGTLRVRPDVTRATS